MSKDCCHATLASNEYTAAWQRDCEVEALELCVLLSEELLAIAKTERYDWPQLKRRICFSPFKPYLLLRETQYVWKCNHGLP